MRTVLVALLLAAVSLRLAAADDVPQDWQIAFKRCQWYAIRVISGVHEWRCGEYGNDQFPDRCGEVDKKYVSFRNKVYDIKDWTLKEATKDKPAELTLKLEGDALMRIRKLPGDVYEVDWEQADKYTFRTQQ